MTLTDRLTFIGIGASIVLAIIGDSCSTNARFADLRAEMNARFAAVNARIDDLRTEIRRIDDRLRVVERGGESDQSIQ